MLSMLKMRLCQGVFIGCLGVTGQGLIFFVNLLRIAAHTALGPTGIKGLVFVDEPLAVLIVVSPAWTTTPIWLSHEKS